MKIYKHAYFARWAKRERLTDKALRQVVEEMQQGLYEADLGAGLYKKRIAIPGQGKSGSYRTLVAFQRGRQTYFIYGFLKSDKGNIGAKEKLVYKALAKTLLSLDDTQRQNMVSAGTLIEVR